MSSTFHVHILTGYRSTFPTSCTLCIRGSSQLTLHSQWLSRKVRTGAVATSAPLTLDRIKPENKLNESIFSIAEANTLVMSIVCLVKEHKFQVNAGKNT